MSLTRNGRKTRNKIAHDGGHTEVPRDRRAVTLACGCVTRKLPQLGNPNKWWCCGAWRRSA